MCVYAGDEEGDESTPWVGPRVIHGHVITGDKWVLGERCSIGAQTGSIGPFLFAKYSSIFYFESPRTNLWLYSRFGPKQVTSLLLLRQLAEKRKRNESFSSMYVPRTAIESHLGSPTGGNHKSSTGVTFCCSHLVPLFRAKAKMATARNNCRHLSITESPGA